MSLVMDLWRILLPLVVHFPILNLACFWRLLRFCYSPKVPSFHVMPASNCESNTQTQIHDTHRVLGVMCLSESIALAPRVSPTSKLLSFGSLRSITADISKYLLIGHPAKCGRANTHTKPQPEKRRLMKQERHPGKKTPGNTTMVSLFRVRRIVE